MALWQPLLAASPKKDAHWPVIEKHMASHPEGILGQVKIDGVRSLVREGVLRRRKLDPVLNKHAQAMFGRSECEGLDGEMVYGDIYNPDVYRISNSNMKLDGSEEMDFWVWDDFTDPTLPYEERYARASHRVALLAQAGMRIHMLPSVPLRSVEEAKGFALRNEELGAEGAMGKVRHGKYKTGRSTIIEGLVIKFKTMEDQEAVITGMEELYSNQNEATTDARGYNKRSSHKENQIPMGTMGALNIRYLDPEWQGREGKCGSGFTAAQRQWFWDNRARLVAEGQVITFKFQRIGSFEKPRFPIYRRLFQG